MSLSMIVTIFYSRLAGVSGFTYMALDAVDDLSDEEGLALHLVDAQDLLAGEMHLQIVAKHAGRSP